MNNFFKSSAENDVQSKILKPIYSLLFQQSVMGDYKLSCIQTNIEKTFLDVQQKFKMNDIFLVENKKKWHETLAQQLCFYYFYTLIF